MGIKGKIALVVGGAGFIGSWIVEKMTTYEPEKIIVIDNLFLGKEENLDEAKKHFGSRLKFFKCDATNYDMLKEILWREGPIDVVFNTAVKPLLVSFVDPVDVFKTASEIVLNLLELQRKEYFDVLIHFSSSEAYGSAQYVPMDEKHALNPTTPYGAGKAATDLLALSYFITFGNDVRIIRPFNNYGPRQNEKTYAGVIPTTIKRILSGQPPIIFGDGEQTRDFTYVEDTAEACVKIYEVSGACGKILNFGSGREVSINELIRMISEIMHYQGKAIHEKPRTADVRRHCAYVETAKDLLGFSARISLEEGLRRTIEWYKNKMREQR